MKKSLKFAILIFFSTAAVLLIIFSPILFKKNKAESLPEIAAVTPAPSISQITNEPTASSSPDESLQEIAKEESIKIPVARATATPASVSVSTPTPTSTPTLMAHETTQTNTQTVTRTLQSVTVKIQGSSINKIYQVEFRENDTAFSVLLRAGEENNFTISYQNYGSLGVFVDCIAGVCGGNNYYWAFYYNGQYSDLGASSQPVSPGDITYWRFEG